MAPSWLEWGIAHKRRVLVACAIAAAVAALAASRLTFSASYAALLPDDAPVVRELEAVKRDLDGGTSDLVIRVSGPEPGRTALSRALAASLAGDPAVARVDAEPPRAFFEDRALYLIDRADLDELARRIDAAYRASIGRALAVVDLDDVDDADPWQPVVALADDLRERYAAPRRQVSADGAYRYLFVRPRVSQTELAQARAIAGDIQARIDAAAAALGSDAAGVRATLAGRLMVHLSEQRSSAEDLRRATLIALVLVIAVLTLALRRAAAPVVVAIPLVLSMVITLAAATALVGELNLISAFTLPALVGLGVDFGIHLYARFLYELNAGPPGSDGSAGGAGADVRGARGADGSGADGSGRTARRDAAMRRAIAATCPASATSAVTTAAAFLSLALVDFRGFRELGLLGGCGVLVTLATTYLSLPPLAVFLTRDGPARGRAHPVDTRDGDPDPGDAGPGADHHAVAASAARPGRPSFAGRGLALVVVGAAGAAAIALGARVPDLAFENDFARLRGTAPAIAITEQIEDDLGLILTPAVFVVPDLAAARAVEDGAQALRDAQSPDEPVGIAEVMSAARLIPADAGERAEILARTRRVLERVLAFGADAQPSLDDPERRRGLERLLALTRAAPYGLDDLPEPVRRRLVAAGGDGLIAYVWPDDKLYRDTVMVQWLAIVDALRARVEAAIGPERAARMRVLDERRIPLDVVALIRRDLPGALVLASLLVVIALAAHFRRPGAVIVVVGAMAVAMALLLGLLVVTGEQLNVYNAVVLPCIVGIGIDNAVHLRHAYDRDRRRDAWRDRGRGARAGRRGGGSGRVRRVLATTGAAALLSSVTTGIGFGAAMTARQGGLVSMGLSAVLGVACALIATTAVLPAALHLYDIHATRRGDSAPEGS